MLLLAALELRQHKRLRVAGKRLQKLRRRADERAALRAVEAALLLGQPAERHVGENAFALVDCGGREEAVFPVGTVSNFESGVAHERREPRVEVAEVPAAVARDVSSAPL